MYDKVWCPKCEKHCYVNLGDMNDMTVDDVEGCRCPHCGHEWVFEEVLDCEPDKTVEDAYIEDGVKTLG